MNIQLEKLELIKMLAETNDEFIIASIKKIFKVEKKDFWDELTAEQQDEINKGIDDFENGRFYSFDEVMKKHL
jgi:predicted transcriptional regulator